jgi:hypothetical protein
MPELVLHYFGISFQNVAVVPVIYMSERLSCPFFRTAIFVKRQLFPRGCLCALLFHGFPNPFRGDWYLGNM